MGLAEPLVTLASQHCSPRAQARALRELAREVRTRFQRSRIGRLCGSCFDDALQRLLLKASTGTTRFRGSTEGEAYGYCRAILANACASERRKGRLEPAASAPEDLSELGTETDADDMTERLAAEALAKLLERLREAVRNTAKRRPESAIVQLDCYLGWRLGVDGEAQLDAFAFRRIARKPDGGHEGRARARLYAIRSRGKRRAREAVAKLAGRGELDEDEARLVARLLDEDEKAGSRRTGSGAAGCRERPGKRPRAIRASGQVGLGASVARSGGPPMPMRPFPEEALPAELTAGARRALGKALESEVYAMTFAGRIMRAPRSGEAARRALRAWLGRAIDAGRAALVAEVVAGKIRLGLELLARGTREEEASERAPGHLWTILLLRDDVESLLVALGVARLARRDPAIARWEQEALRAVEVLDHAAERLGSVEALGATAATRAARSEIGSRGAAPAHLRMRRLAESATNEWWLAPFQRRRFVGLARVTRRALRAAG